MNKREGFTTLLETGKEFSVSIFTVCIILGFSFIANYSGISPYLGLVLVKTGVLFPSVSPILGLVEVFFTRSVVSNNALFENLQPVTESQIGMGSSLLIASNSSGGVRRR
ncbi:L-lactate permease [Bacillus sp. 2205SS5-2]|uniref:L-lactate permease n=1 Tax=Bacillus sp. 2205SS5-2 TaxID=3109031 RepID=UPI003FA54333